jgi:hypothetical protein
MEQCAEKAPLLQAMKDGRQVACHLYEGKTEISPEVSAKLATLAAH